MGYPWRVTVAGTAQPSPADVEVLHCVHAVVRRRLGRQGITSTALRHFTENRADMQPGALLDSHTLSPAVVAQVRVGRVLWVGTAVTPVEISARGQVLTEKFGPLRGVVPRLTVPGNNNRHCVLRPTQLGISVSLISVRPLVMSPILASHGGGDLADLACLACDGRIRRLLEQARRARRRYLMMVHHSDEARRGPAQLREQWNHLGAASAAAAREDPIRGHAGQTG